MNLVARGYVAVRSRVKPLTSARETRQAAMTRQFLAEWESGQGLDSQGLLAATLSHARIHVPYYRQYFADYPDKDPRRLEDWPVLTRERLRNHFHDLCSERPHGGKSWTHASGGSTGKPVAVVHDEYFAAKAQALRDLCARIFFGGPHYNKLILWGMSNEVERVRNRESDSLKGAIKSRLLDLAGLKARHINTFDFTPGKFRECVEVLRHQKPEFIFGYAGSVYQLARYLEKHRIRPPRRPKKIGTTAQTLYPFMRETIERVFGCAVCDHYGSREVGPVAWQHPDGDMYFPEFFTRVEVVDADGEPCAPGEQGRILVTSLHNFSMPLIRYEIGDLGVKGHSTRYQGFPFTSLWQIAGKTNEEFVRPDGGLVHGQFFINLFYYREWLDEFHVVQREPELIDILYVPKGPEAKLPKPDAADIESRIRSAMTENCRIRWYQVTEIPPTKAGKRLYVRSEVERPWDPITPEPVGRGKISRKAPFSPAE